MAKPPKDLRKARIEELKRILNESMPAIELPEEFEINPHSKEYQTFKEEEMREKTTLYEKLCKIFEPLNIEPDKETRKNMQMAIDFAHLKITPVGAFSLAIIMGILLMIIAVIVLFVTVNFTLTISLFVLSVLVIYGLMKYPMYLANQFRVNASQEIILAVLYMVIYMRASPNMEGAIKFAAQNLTGPLAYDLRKILWDVDVRRYENIYDAVEDYVDKWKGNEDFIESMHLIRSSMEQPETRRNAMLDEAVNRILEGTKERMKHYSQSLRMPVMLIYALGIMLPILLLVMMPVVMLMMSETIDPLLLIVMYDVILPLTIFAITKKVLSYRPVSYYSPDISMHPKYSPVGRIKITIGNVKKDISLWPIGLFISLALIVPGALLTLGSASQISLGNLMYSLIITWGIGLGISSVFIIDSGTKTKIRDNVRKLQDEFSEALFQFGSRMALGNPMEKAMEQTVEKTSDLTISQMFKKTLRNMRQGGLALEAALFDKKFGAVWDYPSKLIVNVMRIIFEAAKKGVKNAALSAMAISRYIKQLHQINEDLKEMLGEVTTSMKFLSMFLAPLISGVTITMAAIMMMIFKALGESMTNLQSSKIPGFTQTMIGGWGGVGKIMPLGFFQIIVGIYTIEVIYLLSYLINGVENGPGDKISERDLVGWSLLIGLIIYTLSLVVTYSMFGPMIEDLLTGGSLA
ncbi:MAG: hypothetical protein J7K87_03345 [Candidatus Aenigmarchaeota archaeon]|nr:hypothetical protein [Candidatus Aenigmarchaeota archaeon]